MPDPNPDRPAKGTRGLKWIPSWLLRLLAGFAVAALLLYLNDRFCFESVVVPSSSMRPTLLPNERVFLRRVAYRQIHRFDVVVINSHEIGHRIVKRVIGLPGERVRLEDSWRVFINDRPLMYTTNSVSEPVLVEAGAHEIQFQRNPKFWFDTLYGKDNLLLGLDEYYVLGDNRLASKDGRSIAPVKRQDIQGKMTFIWYSYDKSAGRLRTERILKDVR